VDDAGANGIAGEDGGFLLLLRVELHCDGLPHTQVVEHSVDHGAPVVSDAGMGGHPWGLVDDQQVLVLIDDVQRNGLGHKLQRGKSEHAAADDVTGMHLLAGLGELPVDGHIAGANSLLHLCAADVG